MKAGIYKGPIIELQGCRANLQSYGNGGLLAQFDDMTLEHDGVRLGFGWHEFHVQDFDIEVPEPERTKHRVMIGGVPIETYSRDLMHGVPRMKVSKQFALTQAPELVIKTQDWMTKFFGLNYPIIHAHPGTPRAVIYLHPDHYQQLLECREAILAFRPNPQDAFIRKVMRKETL